MELKPVSELTYNEAIGQLGQIINAMQAENCDIDKLSSYTRRATELIAECRRRLTVTDEELAKILKDFN
ncbi:MAG: exodeoxyribonuclease VII small subunit [Muribaculaceae bacterium]|nr:exodeoxyribonuclease VII small subunit [Muribaculaceae bacterium]